MGKYGHYGIMAYMGTACRCPKKGGWKRRAASWIMSAREYLPNDTQLKEAGFDLVMEYEKRRAAKDKEDAQ